jgi:hypothetical protein
MSGKEIRWQKSSYSDGGDGGQCVEVAATPDSLLLRESEQPDTLVTASPLGLRALLGAIKRWPRFTA